MKAQQGKTPMPLNTHGIGREGGEKKKGIFMERADLSNELGDFHDAQVLMKFLLHKNLFTEGGKKEGGRGRTQKKPLLKQLVNHHFKTTVKKRGRKCTSQALSHITILFPYTEPIKFKTY